MRTSERVRCSRFPVESAALTPVAGPADVARRATATDAAPRIVFVICVLAVAARLIFINQPYVDHWSWRQSDVATIARNFLQNGFRFGYPQIDWAGNAPGYVGTEFPILPFIAAVCYKFAGVHEWIGRIQAVILFAVSLPFFFLLVREIFGSTAAVWASFFFCFTPLNVFAGRSFMPDVPSLSFAIVGLYFFLRWVEHRKSSSFFVAAIAISLSFLIKITSIVIVVPLVYLMCAGHVRAFKSRRHVAAFQKLLLFAAIALATVRDLVLARVSNRREILSPSLLRRRRDSNREFLVVLADSATDPDIQPHAASLTHGADRVVCCAAIEILAIFSLVAGCDGSFHHRPRLRQSPSVVSTPTRTDRRRVCRRRLRLCCLENFFACHRGDFVDSAREFVRNPCVLVRATVLPIICGATSRCRFRIEKSDTARCIDRGRGHGRSDHLLLWRAQGLAFSRDTTRFTTATRTTASRQSRILSGCVAAEQHILFSRKTLSGGCNLIQNLLRT